MAIAAVAELCGKRPSELFEWNDEADWEARLFFDIYVLTLLGEEKYGKQRTSWSRY